MNVLHLTRDSDIEAGMKNGLRLEPFGGALLFAAIAVGGPVRSDDFTVGAPTVTTNGSILHVLDGEDSLTVTGLGSITVGGANVRATEATGPNNELTVQDGAALTTSGALGHGIFLQGPRIAVRTSGDIATSGSGAIGAFLIGDEAFFIAGSDGTIVTTGADNAAGIRIEGADTFVLNGGDVTTAGTNSDGILVIGDAAEVQLSLSSNIAINGPGSDGVRVDGAGAEVLHFGEIVVNSLDGRGIDVSGGAGSQITHGAVGVITTNGNNSAGISIVSQGGIANVDGTIEVTGTSAVALNASGGDVDLSFGGTITAAGVNARGIRVVSDDSRLSIGSGGQVTTSGMNGEGVFFLGNFAAIETAGAIATSGDDAHGIEVQSTGNGGVVINSGQITATGADSSAIYAQGSDLWIGNSGQLQAQGIEGRGIWVFGDRAQVSHAGAGAQILTDNPAVSLGYGIFLDGDDADVMIANEAEIATFGIFSDGVFIDGARARLSFDSGLIETDGNNSRGARVTGDNAEVTLASDARIETQGDLSTGVLVEGADGRLISGGVVITNGIEAHGLALDGSGGTVENTGPVLVQGGDAAGVDANGGNGAIRNAGGILTEGANGFGVRTAGAGYTVENSGFIGATGVGGIGVLLGGVGDSGGTFLNDGFLVTEAIADAAIRMDIADGEIVNTGEIRAQGAAAGIVATGDGAVVHNSGRLFSGVSDVAFAASGANATLRMDAGSVLVGELVFAAAGTATVDVGHPNAALTFNGVPATRLSAGRPQLLIGSTLHVFDPEHFAQLEASGIDILNRIGTGLDLARPTDGAENIRSFWMTGGVDPENDLTTLGGVIGTMVPLSADRYIGLALGSDAMSLETEFGSSSIEGQAQAIAAAWGGRTGSGFFEMTLAIGTTEQDSTRRVANNLAPSGFEDATGRVAGRFFGVSGTFGTDLVVQGVSVQPSLRLRYTRQDFDAFTEAGSISALDVSARSSQSLELRARTDLPLESRETALGQIDLSLYGGADALWQPGSEVDLTVAGLPFAFGRANNGFSTGAFAGARAGIDLGPRSRLDVQGEIGLAGVDGPSPERK
jgi:hypothetical protein